MSSILVINAAGRETRVALVENGHIAEFYLERKKDKGIVGNIYKGRVVRVLPGMQAAFVDIGLEKAAFLYVSDVVYDPDFARAEFELTEGEHDEAPEVPDVPEHTDSGGEHGEPAPAAAPGAEPEAAAAPPPAAPVPEAPLPHEVGAEVQEPPPGELPPPRRTITGEYEALELSAPPSVVHEPAAEPPPPAAPVTADLA